MNALTWEHAGINDNDGVTLMADGHHHIIRDLDDVYDALKSLEIEVFTKMDSYEGLLLEQNTRLEEILVEIKKNNSETRDGVFSFMILIFAMVGCGLLTLIR